MGALLTGDDECCLQVMLRLLHHYQSRQAQRPAFIVMDTYGFRGPNAGVQDSCIQRMNKKSFDCCANFKHNVDEGMVAKDVGSGHQAVARHYGIARMSEL